MTRKLVAVAALLTILSLALAACGGGGGGEATKISLEAQDIKWSSTSISAAQGQPVEVTVANTGALEHNFSVDEFSVNQNVAIGATETVSFTPNSSGTFEFYCNTPGHKEAGMVGTLTVNP